MASKSWKFIVYESDDSTPDFNITNSELVEAPTITSNRIVPLEGRSETISYTIEVGDFSGFLSGKLADADARQDLQGRRVDAQIDSGSGFSTVWTGRWSGSSENDGPGKYSVQLSDERWKERDAAIFRTASTTQIYPAGLKSPWRFLDAAPQARAFVDQVTTNDVLLEIVDGGKISNDIAKFMISDLKEDADASASDGTNGKFEHLRIHVGGSFYEITAFGSASLTSRQIRNVMGGIEDDDGETQTISFVWVAWGTGQPSPADEFDDVYIDADGHEPTEAVPYHIGGEDGKDPFELVKELYDAEGVRYDSNALGTYDASTNPEGLIGHPKIPKIWLRITEPHTLSSFLEEFIFAPFGVVPFNTANGVKPKSVLLPQNEDPNTYTEVTYSNASSHPTWAHEGMEAITSVTAEIDLIFALTEHQLKNNTDWPADRVQQVTKELDPIEHDKISAVGRKNHTLNLRGVDLAFVDGIHAQMAREIFDRYGDGPQSGKFEGLQALESVEVGDFVVINMDTFPNATAAGGRGGSRVVQILEKDYSPAGPNFSFLDAGPDEQPLNANNITISIVKNTAQPNHAVDVTISALPSDAQDWILQIKNGSDPWRTVKQGSGLTTVSIYDLTAGNTIQARLAATAPERIQSDWSSTVSVVLDSLTAPSGLSTTVDGRSIKLEWTNGETDYPIMPTILEGTGGSTEDYLKKPLPKGTQEFTFEDLKASQQYTLGVKHVDPETDSESSEATTTATTGSANTLAEPRRLVILQGQNNNSVKKTPNERFTVGIGLEIGLQPKESAANTIVQVATDAGFSSVVTTLVLDPGVSKTFIRGRELGTTYHVRAKHKASGFSDSGWTSAVSADATHLLAETPQEDNFAAGSARVYANASGRLKLFADTNDKDTDRVYYAVSVNGAFPSVDTTDTEITRANLPYDDNALDSGGSPIDIDPGDDVFVTVGFYNDMYGFGSFVRDRLVWPGGEPSVQLDPSQSGSTATMDVTITDPALNVTAVEFQTKTGGGDFGGTWLNTWDSSTGVAGNDVTLTRSEDITMTGKHNVSIKVRVQWTDRSGTTRNEISAYTFDVDIIPEVQSAVLSFDENGHCDVTVVGDEDCAKIYCRVGGDRSGGTPPDPTSSANSGNVAARAGTIETTELIEIGEEAIVKVRGEDSSGGLGPARTIKRVRSDTAANAPEVQATVDQVGNVGSLDLVILDLHKAITAEPRFYLKSGAGGFSASSTAWDTSTGTAGSSSVLTRGEDFNLSDKHITVIKVEIDYTDPDGTARTWEDSWEFDADEIAEINNISVTFADDNGVVISAQGDEDTSNMYVKVSIGGTPTDPTAGVNHGTISGRSGTVDTGISSVVGTDVTVKVVGENSAGDLGPVQIYTKKRGIGKISDKIYKVGYGSMVPLTTSESLNYSVGYMRPDTTGSTEQAIASVAAIPIGATITKFEIRVYRGSASDTVDADLLRGSSTSGIANLVASLTHTGTGWTTLSTTLNETVQDEMYSVQANLNAAASVSDARFLWFRITYDIDDIDQTR